MAAKWDKATIAKKLKQFNESNSAKDAMYVKDSMDHASLMAFMKAYWDLATVMYPICNANTRLPEAIKQLILDKATAYADLKEPEQFALSVPEVEKHLTQVTTYGRAVNRQLFDILLQLYPDPKLSVSTGAPNRLFEVIRQKQGWTIQVRDDTTVANSLRWLHHLKYTEFRMRWSELALDKVADHPENLKTVKSLCGAVEKQSVGLPPDGIRACLAYLKAKPVPRTPDMFLKKFSVWLFRMMHSVQEARKVGMLFPNEMQPIGNGNQPHHGSTNTDKGGKKQKGSGAGASGTAAGGAAAGTTAGGNINADKDKQCNSCGKMGHISPKCILKDHPNANKETKTPWPQSAAGKAWIAAYSNDPQRQSLSQTHDIKGNKLPADVTAKFDKAKAEVKKLGGGGNNTPNTGKSSKNKGGSKSGKPPVAIRLLGAVTRGTGDGPTTPCLLLHPTLSFTKAINPYLDSMSRETVISDTLAHHLAVQGLAGKPPPGLPKDNVEFELADDTVVKPVDRATIILYSNVTKRSYELHPYVIESQHEWILIGGVDIVKLGLTGVLGHSLHQLYSNIHSSVVENFPTQHLGAVSRDTATEMGTLQQSSGVAQHTRKRGRRGLLPGGNQPEVPPSPSNLVVSQVSGEPTNQQRGISKPTKDKPVLHDRVGAPSLSANRLRSSTMNSAGNRGDASENQGTVRGARKTDESECVRVEEQAQPSLALTMLEVPRETEALGMRQDLFTVFSSPMEQPEGSLAHMTDFFGPVDDTGDAEEYDRAPFDDLEFTAPSESPVALVTINRTNREEAEAIEKLIEEFKDVFAVEVRPEPALVAPIELNVDIERWKRIGPKGAPRPISIEKQEATAELVTDMERLNVIRKSQATPYSQLHLVSKPPTDKPVVLPASGSDSVGETVVPKKKYRPTVDYKIFNTCCDSMGWPLPRIKDVFARIGQHKPKYFAVMDLTSGYHQIPVSVDSIPLTAFVCFMGVYEWLRLPMGVKPAGSFFQQTMQIIFGALLYRIIEIYLDDLIVHAPSFDKYLANLREVFQAARDKRLTFNPKKSKFLFPEVAALGLILSETGIRMSEEKIKKALDFPAPVQKKHLKSFVGLVNYFRDFIPMYTNYIAPFNVVLRDYQRTKANRIGWTDELLKQYQELQEALNNCQLLYFVDDHSPIYLMTDASDYGYGAYLCQIVGQKEHPIAFYSKSFTDVQSRWSTVEQECFAIYSALMEWRCLLEGRRFTIRTDHANLRYMQDSPSDKVNRWKLGYQHFDATIEHFKGTFNRIADGFSRLANDNRIQRLVQDATVERARKGDTKPTVAHLCMCLAISDAPKRRRAKLAAVLRARGEIPPEKRVIIAGVHNGLAGHNGIQITRSRLTEQGHQWKGMMTHIRQFLSECPYCQKGSTRPSDVQTAPYTVSSRKPMIVRAIDTLGPFPQDEEGYTHVVSIIDMFSRLLCLYPVKDTTAEHCVEYALMPHCGLFGPPLYLISDNGKQFVADVIRQFTELTGTLLQPITPYSHQENSLVERSHHETLRHVRALVYDRVSHKPWRKLLPLVQRIVNAQDLPAIGCSPTQLIFGKAIDTNKNIFLKFTQAEQEQMELGGYMQQLYQEQSVLIKKAEELLQKHQLDHQRTAGAVTEFPVNSYVLVRYPPGPGRKSQPPTKLHTYLRGPLKVVRHEGTDYWLQDIVSNRTRRLPIHVSRLVPFKYNPTHTSPQDVARRDLQEFYVEEILHHRYKDNSRQTKSAMEFLVRWKGYDSDWDSWEPWESLRAVKALHRYLARVGLSSTIPREFRRDNYDVMSSDSEEDGQDDPL